MIDNTVIIQPSALNVCRVLWHMQRNHSVIDQYNVLHVPVPLSSRSDAVFYRCQRLRFAFVKHMEREGLIKWNTAGKYWSAVYA
jgi:hypothetical protein